MAKESREAENPSMGILLDPEAIPLGEEPMLAGEADTTTDLCKKTVALPPLSPEIERIQEDIDWLLKNPQAFPDTLEGAVVSGNYLTPLVERHIPLINRFLRQGFSRLRVAAPSPSLRLSDESWSILSLMLHHAYLLRTRVALGDGTYLVDEETITGEGRPVFRMRP